MPRKKSLAAIGADHDVDPVEALYSLRERVGRALDETDSARDVASLARRFADLTVAIAEAQAGTRG